MIFSKELIDFITVAKYKNLSKAADYLGVKQSGLSKSIKRLEEDLNQKLFIRKARGLDFTEAGEVLFHYTSKLDAINEEIFQKFSSLQNELQGHFHIGAHPIIGKFILPKLKSQMDKFSEIELDYHFTTSRECTELVLQGQLDCAIVAMPIQYPDLVIKKLWKEKIGLYSKDGKPKDELLYNNHMIHAQKILRSYSKLKHKRVDDYNLLYSFLKRSDSMGILPHPIAEKEAKLKLIRKFNIDVDICLIYRFDRYQSVAFNTLIKEIKAFQI